MFRDVVTPGTTSAEWETIRPRVHNRVLAAMGSAPELSMDVSVERRGQSMYQDLRLEAIRFTAIPGFTTYGTLVLPAQIPPGTPGILCMHGTDLKLAHRNVLSPELAPNRPYAIELARRGFVTLAVDQLAFGEGNGERTQAQVIEDFYQQYPEWSLDGARLWIHQRAVDLLSEGLGLEVGPVGCIGNSLGGRAAAYLAAFDLRIAAAVPSAGIAPNLTNVFRNVPRPESLSPLLDSVTSKRGLPPFEYQDLLALIAPRAVLLMEPWNDPYNPSIEAVFRCFEKTRFVFELCNAERNLQIISHGDGHDTIPPIREFAYTWLEARLCGA